MYRSILFLSVTLIVQPGYAEDLWSIDVSHITDVVRKVAHEHHPDLVAGDLDGREPGLIFVCSHIPQADSSGVIAKHCGVALNFGISSSAVTAIKPTADGSCYAWETTELSIKAKSTNDGVIVTELTSGGGGSLQLGSTDCPEKQGVLQKISIQTTRSPVTGFQKTTNLKQQLWSINVPRITELALKAAYEQNPELVAGDLLTEMSGVLIFCVPVPENASLGAIYEQCRALINFSISSSAVEEIILSSDRNTCINKRLINERIEAKVSMDGTVEATRSSFGSSHSQTPIECLEGFLD